MIPAFLIIDIGTGNMRASLLTPSGDILDLESRNTPYREYPGRQEKLDFDPELLWDRLARMCRALCSRNSQVRILAVTATSQRQGIVLLDRSGRPFLGMPNLDMRGERWKASFTPGQHRKLYAQTGRWISGAFPALKLRGLLAEDPALADRIGSFLSISDWIGYQFTGHQRYEYSQASETQLLDIASGAWSSELCGTFSIPMEWLPPLGAAGTLLGPVTRLQAEQTGLPSGTPFVIGGADTQTGILGAGGSRENITILSGTTTPLVRLSPAYRPDPQERCLAGRYIDPSLFVVEANAGTTGLNYQRLKSVFFPHMSYAQAEEEMARSPGLKCLCSMRNMIFEQGLLTLPRGGFVFPIPVSEQLTALDFAKAMLFDIACAIKRSHGVLNEISPPEDPALIGVGGGFQSGVLSQMVADLTGKPLSVPAGYAQATSRGCGVLCCQYLGLQPPETKAVQTCLPDSSSPYLAYAADCEALWGRINGL